MDITPRDMRLGRERLTKLLRRAVADAAKGPWHAESMSAIARAQARHARSQNIEAVVVHRAPLGGWFCDIVLREVPAGIARVVGTPVRAPHRTEAEAEAAALPMLTMALAGARQVADEDAAVGGPPPSARVFEYFGAVLEVPERLIGVLETIAGGRPGARYGSADRAFERLDEITTRLFPDGRVTRERLNALPRQPRAALMGVLVMATSEGIFRYPQWRAEPPGKHAPTEKRLA